MRAKLPTVLVNLYITENPGWVIPENLEPNVLTNLNGYLYASIEIPDSIAASLLLNGELNSFLTPGDYWLRVKLDEDENIANSTWVTHTRAAKMVNMIEEMSKKVSSELMQ